MTTTTASASIDFLSSIPSETLRGSGQYGRVYDLQLQRDRAENRLDWLRHVLSEQIERDNRAAQAHGGFGSLTDTYTRIEMDPEVRAARVELERLSSEVKAAQTNVGGRVFLPAVDRLPEIEKRLRVLTRKSAKIGGEPITLTVTDEKLVLNYKISNEDKRGYDFEHVFAVLSGTTPRIPGYEFLAKVVPTEQGNVVSKIPPIRYGMRHNLDVEDRDSDEGNRRVSGAQAALEAIDLSKYIHTGAICEHCHKDRQRKDCYVVYNEATGEALQVGRTCLRLYMGTDNPERVVEVLEQVWDFMRSLGGSRSETPVLSTQTFMTHVAAVIRSRDGKYEKGTGLDAFHNHSDMIHDRRDREGRPTYTTPIPTDEQAAAQVITWAREEWIEVGDYPTNVKITLAGDYIARSDLYNLAASAFTAYERFSVQRRERQVREAKNATKNHVGTIGERMTFELKLIRIRWRSGYGYNSEAPILIMEDAEGNEVVWFASNLPTVTGGGEPVINGVYQVKATVKDHRDDERFGKSTIITRAKFEATISEPTNDEE